MNFYSISLLMYALLTEVLNSGPKRRPVEVQKLVAG